jgi:hypothetical protein
VSERNHFRPPQSDAATPWLHDVLLDLALHPGKVFRMWNWKSAALSIILRGPIFLIASARRGWEVAAAALLTEAVFCAVTAGFYGTLVQAVRNARPKWATGLLITLVMPAGFQGLEYGMHWLRGTPHLKGAEIASVVVSALSALFNWYAMRRGALLVGGEGGNFGGDLRRMPRLLLTFVASPARWVIRQLKRRELTAGCASALTATREEPCP